MKPLSFKKWMATSISRKRYIRNSVFALPWERSCRREGHVEEALLINGNHCLDTVDHDGKVET
jgi:hypothetical protein